MDNLRVTSCGVGGAAEVSAMACFAVRYASADDDGGVGNSSQVRPSVKRKQRGGEEQIGTPLTPSEL
jgi:hypothetical protein